jgi:ArsR family transcriptional regulator
VFLQHFVSIAKALADEGRLRVLVALADRELCVCEIIELLGLAPSTVSKHLSILRQAGIVEARKNGRWIYYRLAGKDAQSEVRAAIEWVRESLSRDPLARDDAKRVSRIVSRRMDACKS